MAENNLKVFVSRIPLDWNENKLKEHFEICFGPIQEVSLSPSSSSSSSSFGFITFNSLESKELALKQSTLHVKKKTIQIRDYIIEDDTNTSSSSSFTTTTTTITTQVNKDICYMWIKKQCSRGNNCKFLHEGEGSCINVSAPGEGKKKCLSFKSKGKCSKGDNCPFLHVLSSNKQQLKQSIELKNDNQNNNNNSNQIDSSTTSSTTQKIGICNSFKKKGKCRKGDNCKYAHHTTTNLKINNNNEDSNNNNNQNQSTSTETTKRKRIDGNELVEKRKKYLLEQNKKNIHEDESIKNHKIISE